jgi:DNA replication protein DnaC
MQTMASAFSAETNRILALPKPTAEEVATRDRQIAEERRRERNHKLWEAWNALTGPMGKRYRDCTLQSYIIDDEAPADAPERKVLAEMEKYAENIEDCVDEGQGLLLFGPSGTGKDHLLVGLSRVAISHELSIRWINGSTLYRAMREGIGEDEEELVNRYVYPSILYVSDPIPPVGALTSFQASTLFAIIDGRYREGKATWASMNVADGEEAEQRLGTAIADRLRDGAVSLNCCWPSFRKGAV